MGTKNESEEMPEERIGEYRVHRVASLFPLMKADNLKELQSSIQDVGQIVPIIVMGDVLLDGRNRLRACLNLGRTPDVREYTGSQIPGDFIYALNHTRRDLTAGQRLVISLKALPLIQAEAKRRQLTGKSADGAAGGRGLKAQKADGQINPSEAVTTGGEQLTTTLADDVSGGILETKPSPGLSTKDERSTVGQLAKRADTSYHQARQALGVEKYAPELIEQILQDKMPLHEAATIASELKAKGNPKPNPKGNAKANPNAKVTPEPEPNRLEIIQAGDAIKAILSELCPKYPTAKAVVKFMTQQIIDRLWPKLLPDPSLSKEWAHLTKRRPVTKRPAQITPPTVKGKPSGAKSSGLKKPQRGKPSGAKSSGLKKPRHKVA
jgi:hypothetical protein